MAAKQLLFAQQARQKMLAGIDVLANAVKETLGPKGRNVLIEKSWGAPTVTKDGVTVAKEIELEDKFENIGAQMVKEVASKTSDTAGDGTTTATVLAQAIFREGIKAVYAGLDPMDLEARHGKGPRPLRRPSSRNCPSPATTPRPSSRLERSRRTRTSRSVRSLPMRWTRSARRA